MLRMEAFTTYSDARERIECHYDDHENWKVVEFVVVHSVSNLPPGPNKPLPPLNDSIDGY